MACVKSALDWLRESWHWSWKMVARAAVAAGFGYAAWIGLGAADFRMALLGLAGLLLLGFWAYAEWIIRNRDIRIGKEGFSITKPSEDPSPVADRPDMGGGVDAFAGAVRDSFIHLGNHCYAIAQSVDSDLPTPLPWRRNWLWVMAYEHYAAANRVKKSILTAFRCMECIARIDDGKLDHLLIQYFEQALWHADGPREEVEDRQRFAEWVRARRTRLAAPDFASTLRAELRRSTSLW